MTLVVAFAGCPADMSPLLTGSQLSPNNGPAKGGTVVTIRGINFRPGSGVLFGDRAASGVKVVNGQLLEVVTPESTPGLVDVKVVTNWTTAEVGNFEFMASEASAPAVLPTSIKSISPATGAAAGGTRVTITGANFKEGSSVIFGGFLAAETNFVSDRVMTAVTPAEAPGIVDVIIYPPGDEAAVVHKAAFEFLAPPEPAADPGDAPRLVGAESLDNNTVLVVFNKPMGTGTEIASHFDITGTDSAFLVVTKAVLLSDRTTVALTTLTQDFDHYTVHVINVKDTFGQEMATIANGPNPVDPTRAGFRGTAPSAAQIDFDSDGDSFGDWFEMKGWICTVHFANGTSASTHVTSNPLEPDTDLDGLDDSVENQFSFDPRTNDTDADHIPDSEEWNEWYSDPANQDTDADGLADPLEIDFFHTSPILSDTDGDQWTDDDELLARNRNPRISDLPVPQIEIGTINIQLDERFAYTDEQGNTHFQERSSQTSLTQDTERTRSTSDTRSSENTYATHQSVTTAFQVGGGIGQAFPKFSVSATVGSDQTFQRGHETTVSRESREQSSQSRQESRAESTEFSENRAVTRTIEDAAMLVDLTITNLSDVAMQINDIEVSALINDPTTRRYVPIATMLRQSVIQGQQDTPIVLGPLDRRRGPFIFADVLIFPQLAEELLESPRAVTFRIANYNITDEAGRNFAFASQQINDRTAGLTIDFGNGKVESYRVATASKFDDLGVQRGLALTEALNDIVGIHQMEGPDVALPPTFDPADPAIRNTFGLTNHPDGGVFVSRVRDVQTGIGLPIAPKRFWVIWTAENVPPQTGIDDIVMRAGENYTLAFVEDRDEDGVFASVEFKFGSSDTNPDTDDDGLTDFQEIYDGWTVAIHGNPRFAYPDPTRADSDSDGLSDLFEETLLSDPRLNDTDEDGIRDRNEAEGYVVPLRTGALAALTPYNDEAIIDGGNGQADLATDPASDDVQVVPVGAAVAVGGIVILPGPNQIIDTIPPAGSNDFVSYGDTVIVGPNGMAESGAAVDDIQVIAPGTTGLSEGTVILLPGLNGIIDSPRLGDDRIRPGHDRFFATDPCKANSDGDAVADGRELVLGANPNNPRDAGTIIDSDLDGVLDADEEDVGWTVTWVDPAGISHTLQVFSDPLEPDSDGDHVPDLIERGMATNPRNNDTDGDGLQDYAEFNSFAQYRDACTAAPSCTLGTAEDGPHYGTNLKHADTDLDGLDDGAEITGWNVNVVGQPSRHVSSNPLLGDFDNDGLTDVLEKGFGTDPSVGDTDEDNVNDGREIQQRGQSVLFGLRNPLEPDQLVSVRYSNIVVLNDCDGGSGEFLIDFGVRGPDNVYRTIVNNFNTGYCNCEVDGCDRPCVEFFESCGTLLVIDDGEIYDVSLNHAALFVLRINGETANISVEMEEKEEGDEGCPTDDSYNRFTATRTLAGELFSDDELQEFHHEPTEASCDWNIKYQMTVIP